MQLAWLPRPDRRQITLPEGHVCLLGDDGSALAEHLARALTGAGWRVVLLRLGPTPQPPQPPADIPLITCASGDENALRAALAESAQHHGPPAAFIYLHPSWDGPADLAAALDPAEAERVRQVFLIARELKQPLQQAAEAGYAGFICVTRLDGQLGLGGSRAFGPVGGALFGLVKTLRREWEAVDCRGIDLDPEMEARAAAERVLGELHDPNRLTAEVGWQGEERRTLALVEAAEAQSALDLDPDTVVLVSGGARGITARCVIALAERYRCRFILLGRSAAVDPATLPEGDEAQLKQRLMEQLLAAGEKPTPQAVQKRFEAIRSAREIANTLAAIRTSGGEAEYLQVDVTDREALAAALAPVTARLGPITAIVHGAGNLADRRIEKKTVADFNRVFAAKVTGLAHLFACIPPNQLRHLVLFSSVVGFSGNIGQTDYAMANEVLNKTAHLARLLHRDCRTVAIGWGPWEGGMVTPALKQAFEAHGIAIIPLEQGAQLLVDEFAAPSSTQMVVGNALPFMATRPQPGTVALERRLCADANPFLADHVIQGHPVLPATCGLAWLAHTCEQLHPGYRFFAAERFQVLKGIVFDATQAEDYTVTVEAAPGADNRALTCEVRISSRTPEGKARYHFGARILLSPAPDAAPVEAALAPDALLATAPAPGHHYGSGEGALFHGPSFQGVRRILQSTPEGIVLECCLPELSAQQQGQFPIQTINPYIGDVEVHAIWLWLWQHRRAVCLPSEIRRYEHFERIPFAATFYVSMRVQALTPVAITADVIAHDQHGKIYSRMLGAKGTVLVSQRGETPREQAV